MTQEDEKLNALAQQLNTCAGTTVTYVFGDRREVLDGNTISQWLSVTDSGEVSLSTEAVAAYVKNLASEYNTAYQPKKLKTSYGKTVTITGGFYGWRINQGAETDALYFVARGDGTSHFSRSLDEHNRAVDKYIR